jgi:hypothetical protein
MGTVIDVARRFGDSLTNLVSRMGTDRDKAAHTSYGYVVQSDEQILAAYRGAWLPRKIVDIPALDSCRKWRNWQGDQSQIELIEAEENRLNLRGKVLEARIKARLLGGSGILIGTGEANLAEPLQIDRIGRGGVRYLTVFSRKRRDRSRSGIRVLRQAGHVSPAGQERHIVGCPPHAPRHLHRQRLRRRGCARPDARLG